MENHTPLHWGEGLSSKESRKQIKLSIKTKIAAWWMIIIGGYFLLIFLKDLTTFLPFDSDIVWEFLVFRGTFIGLLAILLIFLGIFLLRRKRWAWWFAIISLPVYLLVRIWLAAVLVRDFEGIGPYLELKHFVTAGSQAIPLIGIILLPLILLYLDRKNFRKLA